MNLPALGVLSLMSGAMKHSTDLQSADRRLAIAVRGVIQGVGFRPFVYNAARAGGLTGWVRNEADTVRIEVQGDPARLESFLETLRHAHPPQARIDLLEISETPCEDGPAQSFQIRGSSGRAAPRPTIPADLATCAECLQEIRSPHERRYGYPFTNCTNCGPRWSIIERLPYDRPRTSMSQFSMCPDCQAEYEDPADRRFHAQPIACPQCGPTLRLLEPGGREEAVGQGALRAAVKAVLAARIVALKGLGGFQLLADATSARAVALLRQRKQRPHRPFALMLPSLEAVRSRCEVSDPEARALASHEAPILLLRRRADEGASADVVESVAPGNPYLGVMLPYTPLHHLLMAAVDRPIVCTSGNLSEEPMAIATGDALRRLGSIADVLLVHNRPIVRPVDDSVARVGPEGLQVLRRARGFAPLPIELDIESPTILAVGGHLKNTVALALGSGRVGDFGRGASGEGPAAREVPHPPSPIPNPRSLIPNSPPHAPRPSPPRHRHPTQVILSPHVGDLDNVLSVEVHRRAIRDLVDFFEAVPEVVACDLHPDYASTREAEALAARWKVPLVRVQHHHAHVAACATEHQLEGPVLGLAWDGTGYGPDGTVWGGEALICEGAGFVRAAHLRTFALPGGDKAVRQPRRSALGVLFEILGEQAARHAAGWFTRRELETLLKVLARSVHAPRTSSMGRLFDAVAVLCGLPTVISFEGQAAMALEFAADQWAHNVVPPGDPYPLPLSDDVPAVADWEPLIRAVLSDAKAGEPAGRIGLRFHNALAELAVAVAQRAGCSQVVLSGGCFQNALLSERVRRRLLESGFSVYTHRRVPPGDGGIALGQAAVAARQAAGA
jgi:hydrogenase maturation protein HypF